MNTDPVAFLREDLPALFNRGVAQLRERAAAGDEKVASRLEDIEAASGAVRVLLEGEGGASLWLVVGEGSMQTREAAPDDRPTRFGVAAPADAVRAALEEIEEEIDEEKAARRVARSASGEVEKLLEGHALGFHLRLVDLPRDPDEVTLRVAVGSGDPPEDPSFTVTLSWDDVEEVRDGELTGQQLLGRLKIGGDASQAMTLGMQLMQRRPRR